jgi:hypothetical protein
MATRGYFEEYTLDELNELYPGLITLNSEGKHKSSIEENLKKDDDKLLTKTWTAAYKMAAYYYDTPEIEQRSNYFNLFRYNFANILYKTKTPNELPDLTSRTTLVEWVCKKHNEFLEVNQETVRVDCNLEKLLKTYGPNYDKVEGFLGEHQYDF